MDQQSQDDELQQILDALPLLFFQKDTENRIIRTNKAAAESRGVTVDMLVGAATTDWFPDEAGKYHLDDLDVIRSGEPRLGIVEQIQVAGSAKHWTQTDKWPHYGPDGEIDGVLVFVRDATVQATAEEALRQREAHLGAILASEPECVKVLDDEGRLVEMNPAGLRMIEASSLEQAVGVSVYDLLLPDYHDGHRELHAHVLEGGSGRMEYEIVGLHGTPRWIETHAAPLEGGKHRFLAISRDITEQKRSERERESLQAQLRHVQRLEGIGLLAGGVAHDFNNYLMVIMGSVELALGELEANAPIRPHLDSVLRTTRQAADVCDQLLTYAGQRTLDRAPTDVSELIAGMDELLRVTVSKDAQLDFELAADLPSVVVDPVQLRQVIVNLVGNASDALGGQRGVVRVSTGVSHRNAVDLAGSVVSSGTEPGAHVFVSVRDTGAGIAPEVHEQIFDPFFTTKAEGRGLGLATVMGTIRGHGGAIDVQSKLGLGTTVTVRLPTSDRVTQPTIDLPNDVTASDVESRTVLVVDDEAPVRAVLCATLGRAGFSVVEAASGREAVELFACRAGEIDAVVLDMTMPGLDGPQTYAELCAVEEDVPVLFSSGYPQQQAIDRFGSREHVSFIQKPYSGSELVESLSALFSADHSAGQG